MTVDRSLANHLRRRSRRRRCGPSVEWIRLLSAAVDSNKLLSIRTRCRITEIRYKLGGKICEQQLMRKLHIRFCSSLQASHHSSCYIAASSAISIIEAINSIMVSRFKTPEAAAAVNFRLVSPRSHETGFHWLPRRFPRKGYHQKFASCER